MMCKPAIITVYNNVGVANAQKSYLSIVSVICLDQLSP